MLTYYIATTQPILQRINMKNVTIAYNAVNAVIHEPTKEVKILVQQALSYQVQNADRTQSFKQHKWDGRSTFFNYTKATFPAGFVHLVSAHLKKNGFKVNLVRKPLPEPLGESKLKNAKFEPRPYQLETIEKLVKHGQIIAQVATGGGKSIICQLAHARINRPTLFLTTRSVLMYQMYDNFQAQGVNCSIIGDGQFGNTDESGKTTIKKMTLGMVQTLISKLEQTTVEKEFQAIYDGYSKKFEKEIVEAGKVSAKQGVSEKEIKKKLEKLIKLQDEKMKKLTKQMQDKAIQKCKEKEIERQKTIKLLSMFELVILEEAHEASGNSYYEILRHCKNANYRLALTATPFMKENEESNMRLMACSGPIAIKITEKQLIDSGVLAKPYFKFIQLKQKPNHIHRRSSWQSAYRLVVKENKERNELIVKEIKNAIQYGLTAMVLVQHTEHGVTLRDLLEKHEIKSDFIRGENDQNERKQALTKLANGDIKVLIGTTILDVGVDVPAVGLIVLAGGGKAEVALRQRIGRGLRAKKNMPNYAFIVDFSDHWNDHTKQHALQRQDIIKTTNGFGENIVDIFDFESLGFTKQ